MIPQTISSHLVGFLFLLSGLLGAALGVAPGTTPRLREIFIGRCYNYQHVINREPFKDREVNCTDLWQKFEQAFRYRDPCDVPPEKYNNFTQAALHSVPEHQTLVWENVQRFVREYSYFGKRATTIADTLTGFVVEELHWCGQQDEPGFNYTACPDWATCDHAEYRFWTRTSIAYAKEAHGVVRVMLNGSAPIAYDRNSVFARYELPNLNTSKVVLLHALVIHDLMGPRITSCGTETLKDLEKDAKMYNIPFNCTDDPKDVMHLMCVDHAAVPLCRSLALDAANGADKSTIVPSIVLMLASLFLLVRTYSI